jgi:predicted CXXCH cytochrome family protein
VNDDKTVASLDFQNFQREWLIPVDQLSEDNNYLAEVSATDRGGRTSDKEVIDIVPNTLSEHEGQPASLKLTKLDRLTVNEIEKSGFVRARISWYTNAFAISEMEYGLKGEGAEMIKVNDVYAKTHEKVIDDLKHKSIYYFRAVSRDIYGNTLRSEEFTIDTSKEFSPPDGMMLDNLVRPHVSQLQVFLGHKSEEVYLKVTVNKPVRLSVTIKEVPPTEEKHGPGLLPERFSKIDACYKCHTYNASHPVGVKAESPTIRTPQGLPTIENGIITCITCHEPHGGDRAYYSRFDFNKDLCMRCHLEKYGGRL